MSGGWAGSTRAARLPANWPAIRQQVLDRDGRRCTAPTADGRCPATATEVDHVQAMTDSHELADLQSLCHPHHQAKSSSEGGTAWAARRAAGRRQPEAHPGLA